MSNEIEKTDQPNPDDVLAAIQSFNDPSIITGIFAELGWSYSVEIRETLMMAKQNANLSIKFKAVKHLRELLREAAESAGYTANVSQTIHNADGGQTTFSAKRMTTMLNPIKQIESTIIKEPKNDQPQESKTESDRDCNRKESQGPEQRPERSGFQEGIPGGTDTRSQFPPGESDGRANPGGDAISGGLESTDGGEAPERQLDVGGDTSSTTDKTTGDSEGNNPCIQTRPPTCNQDLYPGISTSAEGD